MPTKVCGENSFCLLYKHFVSFVECNKYYNLVPATQGNTVIGCGRAYLVM